MAHWISQRLQTRKAQRSYNREWLTSRMFRRATWHRSTPEKATCDASLQSEGEHLWNSCCLLRRRCGPCGVVESAKSRSYRRRSRRQCLIFKVVIFASNPFDRCRRSEYFPDTPAHLPIHWFTYIVLSQGSSPHICHVEAVSNCSFSFCVTSGSYQGLIWCWWKIFCNLQLFPFGRFWKICTTSGS